MDFTEHLKLALEGEYMGTKGMNALEQDMGKVLNFSKLFGKAARDSAKEQEAAAAKYKLAWDRAQLAVQQGQERLTKINISLAKAEADGKIEQVERYKRAAILAQQQVEIAARNSAERQRAYNDSALGAGRSRAGIPFAVGAGLAGSAATGAGAVGLGLLGVGAATVMPAMRWEDFLAQQGATVGWNRGQMARIQSDAFRWARQSGGSPNDYVTALTTGLQRGFGYQTSASLAQTSGMIGLPRGLAPGDVASSLAPILSMFPSYKSNVMGLGGMLAQTSQVTGLSVTDFGSQATPLLQLVASIGPQELPDALAAVATLKQKGYSTEKAIQLVARIYGRLLTPGSAVLKAATSVGLGGDFSTEALRSRGLMSILGDMSKLTPSAIGTLFGSTQRGAGAGVLTLSGGGNQTWQDLLNQMKNAGTSAVKNPWQEFLQLPTTKFKRLEEQFRQTAIAIGTDLLPVVNDLMKDLQPVLHDFDLWIKQHKGLVEEAVKLAPDLLLVAGGLKAISFASNIASGAGGLPLLSSLLRNVGTDAGEAAVGEQAAATGAAGLADTGPVGLAALGIAALGVSFIVAYDKSEKFRKGINKLASELGSSFHDVGIQAHNLDLAVATAMDNISKSWVAAAAKVAATPLVFTLNIAGKVASNLPDWAPWAVGLALGAPGTLLGPAAKIAQAFGLGQSGSSKSSSPGQGTPGALSSVFGLGSSGTKARPLTVPTNAVPTGSVFGTPAGTIDELNNPNYPGGRAGGIAHAGVGAGAVVHSDIQYAEGTHVKLPGGADAKYRLIDANAIPWPKGGDPGGGNYQLWTTEVGGKMMFFHLEFATEAHVAGVWKNGWVKGGTWVATSGNTGNMTNGAHLHVGMDAVAEAYVYSKTGGRGWQVAPGSPTTTVKTNTPPLGTTNIPAAAAKAKKPKAPPTPQQWASWWAGQASDIQSSISNLFGNTDPSKLTGPARAAYVNMYDIWALDNYEKLKSQVNAAVKAGTITRAQGNAIIGMDWKQYLKQIHNPFASAAGSGVSGIQTAQMIGRCKAEAEANIIRRKQLGAANAGATHGAIVAHHAPIQTELLKAILAEIKGANGVATRRHGTVGSVAQRVPGIVTTAAGGLGS